MPSPSAIPKAEHPVIAQLCRILTAGRLPARSPGYMRGVDFYPASSLFRVVRDCADHFHEVHGRCPDIVDPERMSDKIFWSKFFRPLKVPETGNKLLTSRFIPDALKGVISCAPIVWHSKVAKVPRGGEVQPGTYYLKANHGSNMFRRITYPIGEAEADALDAQFAQYLKTAYGLRGGEWWYGAFQHEVLLEKSISTMPVATSWDYYVIGGEVPIVVAYQKTPEGPRKTYLTADFTPLDEEVPAKAEFVVPSERARELMLTAARAIGGPLGFARVDFLLDDDERPYLGEITFTPAGGLSRKSSELDLMLGRMWDLSTLE